MAVMDEFKEERERMKSQPFKVRFAYFWDYHKFHVLIAAFGEDIVVHTISASESIRAYHDLCNFI